MAVSTGIGRGTAGVWGVAALLLLLPLVAMQFTHEVAWSPGDFAVFGAMLLVACGTYELAARVARSGAYRAAVGVALTAAFLLGWVNLAVGIAGSEGQPVNAVFAGVLAVGVVGAFVARFRPRGMARALVAMALAQLLAGALALRVDPGPVLAATGLFVALWLTSAWLFRKAARQPGPAAP